MEDAIGDEAAAVLAEALARAGIVADAETATGLEGKGRHAWTEQVRGGGMNVVEGRAKAVELLLPDVEDHGIGADIRLGIHGALEHPRQRSVDQRSRQA